MPLHVETEKGKMVLYCDQAAAAKADEEVLAFFADACRTACANQEALHYGALEVRKALAQAGSEFARLLTGGEDFVTCWTNSGTGAFLLLENASFPSGCSALASELEHPALTAMLKRRCAGVELLKCDGRGRLRPRGGDFGIAAFHAVQSELGVMQDIPELMGALPERCVRFVDAVQLAGKMPMEKVAAAADLIAVSGMKFGAPGGGALLVRRDRPWSATLLKEIAASRHPRYTVPRVFPPAALCCAHALRLRCEAMPRTLARMRELNAFLRRELASGGAEFIVPEELSTPFILHLYLPGKQGAVAVRMLSERGILAGSGSACASESSAGSPALRAVGYSGKRSYSGLRLSFGYDFSREQADFLVKNLLQVLKNY